MKLSQVEHAVHMIRVHLIECALRDDWTDDRVTEVTQVIRGYVERIAAATPAASPIVDRRLPRETLRQVVRFVNGNLDTKLKWQDIAADIGMDRHRFGKRFKLTTGMTPHEYVVRCRLRRAMKLLTRSELSIVDIALEVGCGCQSHFTTMFRKRTGTTPAAFRSGVTRTIRDAARPPLCGGSVHRVPARSIFGVANAVTVPPPGTSMQRAQTLFA